MSNTIKLHGSTPVPLAGYLKALGVLRIVSEQVDSAARGWWEGNSFALESSLQPESLVEFLLNEYAATPLVAPWNGGSGFFSNDNKVAIDAICDSDAERFAAYRELIGVCRRVLESMQLSEKPDSDAKPILLQQCRNQFPDSALDWLDAAFVLTGDGPKYPPLLGTGGNDGRLEFTNNYMQRLTEVFDTENGLFQPGQDASLRDALFDDCGVTRDRAAIGQFDPGSAGGANSAGGYDANPTMNVWDFILMLEGALAFAGASVRKLDSATSGALSYPFCVRSAGIGYASADLSDEASSRSEMWMPLWSRPTTFRAVSHLLSEGRVNVGRRQARNGIDFARAVASVGVDRGIDSFQRFGFQQRNGLSYFAVPLGRFEVREASGAATLLGRLDRWLDRFRRAATGQHAPGRAAATLRRVESAVLDVCQQSEAESTGSKRAAPRLLIALGSAETAIATSPKLREADYPVSPVPLLSPEWISATYDPHSPTAREYRLAAALASIGFPSGLRVENKLRVDPVGPFRRHVEPVAWAALRYSKRRRASWADQANDPSIVWTAGSLVRNLNSLLTRRVVDAVRLCDSDLHAPFDGRCPATLTDIFHFIEGNVDDQLIDALARGLMLIDWPKVRGEHMPWPRQMPNASPEDRDEPLPSADFCLLKMCLLPHPVPVQSGGDIDVKLAPQIFRRSAIGQISQATQLAARRLRSSGIDTAIDGVNSSNSNRALRTSAALVFPLRHESSGGSSAVTRIRDRVVRREAASNEFDNAPAEVEAS